MQLDQFVQRGVTEVESFGKVKKGEPVWTITLDGDVKIHNFDSKVPDPGDLVGLSLTFITMDSGQREGSLGTVMFFGDRTNPRREQIAVNPMEYAIEDPTRPELGKFYPQRSEANPVVPPHPDERVADGPEPGWEEAQIEADAHTVAGEPESADEDEG